MIAGLLRRSQGATTPGGRPHRGEEQRGERRKRPASAASAEKCAGHFAQSGNIDQMAIWCGLRGTFLRSHEICGLNLVFFLKEIPPCYD